MSENEDQYVDPFVPLYNQCTQTGLRNAQILNTVAGKQPDGKYLRGQMRLIIEEIDETIEAIQARHVEEIRDGAADIRVVTTGYVYLAGWGYQQMALNDTFNPEGLDVAYCVQQLKVLRDDFFYMVEQYLDSDLVHINTTLTQKLLMSQCLATLITYLSGYDPIVDDEIVFTSNMSKFDMVRQNAENRAEEYRQEGAVVVVEEVSVDEHTYYPIVTSAECELNGKMIPRGKFLKSSGYQPPQWV